MKFGTPHRYYRKFLALIPHQCVECGMWFWLSFGYKKKYSRSPWSLQRYVCGDSRCLSDAKNRITYNGYE